MYASRDRRSRDQQSHVRLEAAQGIPTVVRRACQTIDHVITPSTIPCSRSGALRTLRDARSQRPNETTEGGPALSSPPNYPTSSSSSSARAFNFVQRLSVSLLPYLSASCDAITIPHLRKLSCSSRISLCLEARRTEGRKDGCTDLFRHVTLGILTSLLLSSWLDGVHHQPSHLIRVYDLFHLRARLGRCDSTEHTA